MRALEKLEAESKSGGEKIISGGLSFPEIKRAENSIIKHKKALFFILLLFVLVCLFTWYQIPFGVEKNKNQTDISQKSLLNRDKPKEERNKITDNILDDKKLAYLLPDKKAMVAVNIQPVNSADKSNIKTISFQDEMSVDSVIDKGSKKMTFTNNLKSQKKEKIEKLDSVKKTAVSNNMHDREVTTKNERQLRPRPEFKEVFHIKSKTEKRESFKNKINFFSANKIPLKTENETSVDLQAIAWDADPDKKMIVANNRILHEGSSYKGIEVSFIGLDYVVFSQNGDKWRQTIRR